MLVFCKTMDMNIYAFGALSSDTIINLKEKIEKLVGLTPNAQRLVYQGQILDNDKTVEDYQICERSMITVFERIK